MSENKKVEVKEAKGRPMLSWVGKKPLRNVIVYPSQLVETFQPKHTQELDESLWKDWNDKFPKGGLLFHGDNKDVLAHLLANGFRGKINLIYIDPPFDSGADYVRKVKLRGGSKMKLMSEGYTLGEQVQYADIWANDNYLQFMYERLLLLRELLSEDGTIYLHCDDKKAHLLRILLDEAFSPENFMNEVLWVFRERGISKTTWNRKHNNIFVYAKNKGRQIFNVDAVRDEYSEATKKKFKYKDEDGYYQIRGRNIPGSPVRQADGLSPEHEKKYPEMTYRQYMEDGQLPVDWWEISLLNKSANERTNYPTQKPEELVEQIVKASSNPNSIVLDCFIGSGTTAAVAQKLGRRWIGADINKGAIQTTTKRLQSIIEEQMENKAKLLPNIEEGFLTPAQSSFSVYRVNDYDLQVQHNEALNLACEHLGITRTKTDVYFDGTLGKKLVKIAPFNHPITPLDLEEVKRELNNRPQEERNVVVVGYGKELSIQTWLEDWNRNRKRTGLPNQIEIKDLRVDAKSGGFFVHKPAEAIVNFNRKGSKIEIEVETFVSPTVIERLKLQHGLLTPQIDDWRAMVDSVMIDSSYDGKVFNIVLSDVPEKKNDLVDGKYIVEAENKTTVAVKITDMLGEELLIVKEI